MQNEERSKLEERIIAYFDGSLDNEGSRSLLREVAESPEKRSLFKAHETLSRLIAAAREPMEAPLEVKRSIAEKIPGMLAFIPSLFGAAETAPVFTENSNPFIAFFARMSISTAVSIGGAVAVLITSGILIKNSVDQNAGQNASPKASYSHNTAAQNPATASTPSNSASLRGASNSTKDVSIARGDRHVASSITFASIGKYRQINWLRDNVGQESEPVQSAGPTENDNAVDNSPAIMNVTPPLESNVLSPMRAYTIPNGNELTLSSLPIVAGEGVVIRTYASAGDRLLYLNGINGPASMQLVPSEVLGVEFDLGDRYMFRVQAGKTGFAELVNNNSELGSQHVITSTISSTAEWWSTVGMSYSFANLTFLPIIVSGDVGAVWFNSPSLMTRMGLSTELPLFGKMALRPSLTYDEVLTSLFVPSGDGIYTHPIQQTSMWSGALGFNLGFVIQY